MGEKKSIYFFFHMYVLAADLFSGVMVGEENIFATPEMKPAVLCIYDKSMVRRGGNKNFFPASVLEFSLQHCWWRASIFHQQVALNVGPV